MKTGLGKSALLFSFAIVGVSGCKATPYCEPLGACGGDVMAGAVDFAKHDGIVDREWTVTTQNACQDQLQLPPLAVSLVRQPPVPANVRPPDNTTADWCGNLVFKATGEVQSFLVYAPPLPLKVGSLTMSADFDNHKDAQGRYDRGTYAMQTTILQTRDLSFSETCLTGQGLRLTCPNLGRRLGEFLAAEANIYSMRCFDPPGGTGGCDCQFELSFIGGPNGRWAYTEDQTHITFFDATFAPPAIADYCFTPTQSDGNGELDLTGNNETPLFNQKSLRTLVMLPPSCHDGVQSTSIGELGVDCGPNCPDNPVCGTCSDGKHDNNEEGIDCGGACLGVLCDPDTSIAPQNRHPACADGKQEPWEEGVDCGGPCSKECP
jgi:hypothetical protein